MMENNNERLITYVTKEVKEGLELEAGKRVLSVSAYLRSMIIKLVKDGE